MTVRTVRRRGTRRLVIDIHYTSKDGRPARFRQDAEVQMLAAARAEERRRIGLLAITGLPYEPTEAITVAPVKMETIAIAAPAAKPSRPVVTFAEAKKHFLALYAETRLKPSTQRGYKGVLESHLAKLDDLELPEIDATVVRELDLTLVKSKARPSTRRNVQCVLRAVLRFSVEQGLAGDDLPRMPPLPKVGVVARIGMSDDEMDRVLAATDERYRIAFMIARYAGLRAGEVRALRRRDVDLTRGVLVVRRSRCQGVEAPPKSGHERVIPIHSKLRSVLEALPRATADAYVTGPEPGEPWAEYALGHAFTRACAKAGVTGFHLHDIRHWFVTELFKSGAPAPVVQKLAGHAHLVTTQRYAHVAFEDLAAGIRGMGSGNGTVTVAFSRRSR